MYEIVHPGPIVMYCNANTTGSFQRWMIGSDFPLYKRCCRFKKKLNLMTMGSHPGSINGL